MDGFAKFLPCVLPNMVLFEYSTGPAKTGETDASMNNKLNINRG